jgi:predicted transcriptional regulator
MEDYSHLRKAHKDEEKETLLNAELSASDAKECLDTMKEISRLIEKVTPHLLFRIF